MSIKIGIGTGLAPPLGAADFYGWADLCEACGIDSIWVSDQIMGQNPEPLAMLGALAARTRRLRLGTNVLVIPFREPVLLAKQIATLDWLAEGRLLPVFGVGNAIDPLWEATGRNPALRGRQADEAITLFRLLLEQEEVQFVGEFYRYEGAGTLPRRQACPPIWTGGDSPAAIRRSARLSDGWLGGLTSPDKAGKSIAAIKDALVETGRSIDPDHYGITLPMRIGDANDPAVRAARERFLHRIPEADRAAAMAGFAVGSPDHVVALIRACIAQGVQKFVALPIASDAGDLITQTRLLAEQILPHVEGQN